MNPGLHHGAVHAAIVLAAAICANAAVAATYVSWESVPMTRSGDTVATDGTLVCAWCQANDSVTNTVNGVPFVGRQDVAGCADFGLSGEWFWDLGGTAPYDVGGAWSNLLSHGWWGRGGDNGEYELQLKRLTPGATYQVQFILCSQKTDNAASAGHTEVWAPGGGSVSAQAAGYGGSLVGTFVAESATESFLLQYADGPTPFFNAIQVRKIVSGSLPSIGSLSASSERWTATITLADVGMGTDEDGNPATKYSVSYRLDDGEAKTVLQNQTGETVSFDIPNLRDGDHVCSVWIETDRGKTSEPASVAFEIFALEGDFNWLKTTIESASDGDTVSIPRGIYAATSAIAVTAADLTVVSRDGKAKTILDGGSACGLFNVTGTGFSVRGVTFKNGRSTGVRSSGAEPPGPTCGTPAARSTVRSGSRTRRSTPATSNRPSAGARPPSPRRATRPSRTASSGTRRSASTAAVWPARRSA